jgi:hypothetical protein
VEPEFLTCSNSAVQVPKPNRLAWEDAHRYGHSETCFKPTSPGRKPATTPKLALRYSQKTYVLITPANCRPFGRIGDHETRLPPLAALISFDNRSSGEHILVPNDSGHIDKFRHFVNKLYATT